MNRAIIDTDRGPVDAVIGYRGWRASAEEGVVELSSMFQKQAWPTKDPLQSQCRCYEHCNVIGPERCRDTCGIYAFALFSPVRYIYTTSDPVLCGEVALWGWVVEHERGYRAQFARPFSIFTTPFMDGYARRIAELAALQYGIPLVTYRDPVAPAVWQLDTFPR